MDQSQPPGDGPPLTWDAWRVRTASAKETASTTCPMDVKLRLQKPKPVGKRAVKTASAHGRIPAGPRPRAREDS